MSGFEIAGAVLGAIPLLISALEHYGEGVKTIKSMIGYKALIGNLVLDFRVENSRFRRGCEKLLTRLKLPPEEVEELLNSPNGQRWNDPALDKQIQKLLGRDYDEYQLLMARLFKRLDKFSEKLELIDFTPKWMRGSKSVKLGTKRRLLQRTSDTWRAIKVGFDRDEYAAAITEIKGDIGAIGSVVGDAIELEAPRRERDRSANTRFWSLIRRYAASLFKSIRWQCACASGHTVNLRLRIQKKPNQQDDISYGFVVLFSYSPNSCYDGSIPWVWRQAEVQPSEIFDPHISGTVSFALAGLPSPPPIPSTTSQIVSLCQALKFAPQKPSCIGFIDYDQCRHHIYSSCQDEERTVISLKQVLQDSSTQTHIYGVKARYQLAVTLAFTVLQLCKTNWLDNSWSKEDIYFIKGGSTSFAEDLYVRKPDVTVKDTSQSVLPAGLRPWSNPSLFALAVIFLELYFGRPIESIPDSPTDLDPAGNPWPHGFTEFLKVSRLVDEIDPGIREKEESYFKAIERCLKCNFDTRTLDLENARFQELFYLEVIAPLEKCYDLINTIM